jgi:cytochrome c oxidase subunit 3
MTIITRSLFQSHPFHLVSPSPWPLNTSFSLLGITFGAVLTFQGFIFAINILNIGLLSLVLSMSLWFRDVISEGRNPNNLNNLILKTIFCRASL